MVHQVSCWFFILLCWSWNKANTSSEKTHIFILIGESIFHQWALKWGSTPWFSPKKTFSLRCQLQIHDGVATLVFGSYFSCSRLMIIIIIIIIIQGYQLLFIVIGRVKCLIFSFFLAYNKLNCGLLVASSDFEENGANRWWAYAIPAYTPQFAQKKAFSIAFFLPSWKRTELKGTLQCNQSHLRG